MSAEAYMQDLQTRIKPELKHQQMQGYLFLGLGAVGMLYMGLQKMDVVQYLPDPDVKLVFAFFISIAWIISVVAKLFVKKETPSVEAVDKKND